MPRGIARKGSAGNMTKQARYVRDWGLSVNKAIGTQNYREAVMTLAGILEDRLLSFLFKARAFESNKTADSIKKTRLGELRTLWKKHATEPLEDRFIGDLYSAVQEWAHRRNRIAHGGAGSLKSLPGEDHPDPNEFDAFAKQTALDGVRLVKSVQNWYNREKGRRRREGRPLD